MPLPCPPLLPLLPCPSPSPALSPSPPSAPCRVLLAEGRPGPTCPIRRATCSYRQAPGKGRNTGSCERWLDSVWGRRAPCQRQPLCPRGLVRAACARSRAHECNACARCFAKYPRGPVGAGRSRSLVASAGLPRTAGCSNTSGIPSRGRTLHTASGVCRASPPEPNVVEYIHVAHVIPRRQRRSSTLSTSSAVRQL